MQTLQRIWKTVWGLRGCNLCFQPWILDWLDFQWVIYQGNRSKFSLVYQEAGNRAMPQRLGALSPTAWRRKMGTTLETRDVTIAGFDHGAGPPTSRTTASFAGRSAETVRGVNSIFENQNFSIAGACWMADHKIQG